MRYVYVYRLVVTLPEGCDAVSWRPEGYKPGYHPDDASKPFKWPRRRHYLNYSAACRRASLLIGWGATVDVARSRVVQWDEP